VLTAFHNLGHFEEMEGFLKFLLGIARKHGESHERLAPVYTLSQELPLPETIREQWKGYGLGAVVRTNNQAAEHVQNDVYGEMALTLAPIFLDERFFHLRDKEHENLLAYFGRLCDRSISVADAGLWEFRDGWQEHTFTNLMAWAGLERIERVRRNGYLKDLSLDVGASLDRALKAIESAAREGAIRNGPKDASFDASLAMAVPLRFPREELCGATVSGIQKNLAMGPTRPHSSWFYRYLRNDDFGRPESAFVICSFWVAQALARLGRMEEARSILEDLSKGANHVGLLSEHFHPGQGVQLGNFPQAYSHVGLINAAFAVSPPWSEVL
jgi:GH15 family glucan-1,4-alpha-glucosidase